MKLTSLQNVLSNPLTTSLTDEPTFDRGSGRLVFLGLLIYCLLFMTGAAWAGDRNSFPEPRCPGSGCPDNAQPQ